MQAARWRARASCSRSAAGRDCKTAVTDTSPRDHVLREVLHLPRDLLAEQIVDGEQVLEDVEEIAGIGDPLRKQAAQQTAVRVAHRQVRGRGERQAFRLEANAVDPLTRR